MIDIDFVNGVIAESNAPQSPDHGEQHWKAVAYTGQKLCAAVPDADALVVFLFALFHDTKRESEWHDPDHGPRAVAFALEKLRGHTVTLDQKALLVDSIGDHDRGWTATDPTVGVCWDADRLQLARVNVVIDPEYLSTDAAREQISLHRRAHSAWLDWASLLAEVPQ